jgi:hypothetical protein
MKQKESIDQKTARLKALRLAKEITEIKPKQKSEQSSIIRFLSLDSLMPFGKYKNKTIEDILFEDKNYIKWALETIKDFHLDDNAYERFNELSNQYIPPKAWESPKY